jgi:hypothetical protein
MSQGAPQPRANINVDIDFIASEIVRADDEFAPDLRDMYMDLSFTLIEARFPQLHQALAECGSGYNLKASPECAAVYIEAMNRIQPFVHDVIERKRQAISPDPLQNYDGIKYMSPFWFEGAGDVWRRVDHGSRRYSIKSCADVRRNSENCLTDPTKPNDYCFRLYGHALICEPGYNCPYLRFPLMKCIQEGHISDYARLKNCVEGLPNYAACTRGYVAQNV